MAFVFGVAERGGKLRLRMSDVKRSGGVGRERESSKPKRPPLDYTGQVCLLRCCWEEDFVEVSCMGLKTCSVVLLFFDLFSFTSLFFCDLV